VNARAVENGLTIALGKATSCAVFILFSTLFMIEGVTRGLVPFHEESGGVVAMASQYE
jgi:hypothetical protein